MSRGRANGGASGRPSGPWSVRTYLLVIVGAAVVAVGTGSGYGFLWSAGAARDGAMDDMSLQARRAASAAGEAIATGQQTVAGLAAQPGLRKVFARPDDCSLTATAGLRLDIVGPDGGVACSSDPAPAVVEARVHAGSDWLDAALRSSRLAVDWDATDAALGRRAVVVTAPVDAAEPEAGAVALFIHVPGIASTLARDHAGSDQVSFTVVDRRTQAVLSASEGVAGGRFPATGAAGDWKGADGARRFFNSADVAGSDWRVFAGVRRSAVLAGARGALMRHLLVGLLALLVLLAAVWMLNRRVAGPLRRFIDAVARAAREPDGPRVGEEGTAELVALAREFNSMLDVRAGHEAQLLFQATHDPLTGLPNKALLIDQLAEAIGAGGDGIAVFCVGLDRLDMVTDGFGHDAGDRVVADVAGRLSEALDPGATLARFGGVEFAVLCTGVGREAAGAVAERLLRCLERPFRGPAAGIVVTGAIGVAMAGDRATSPEQLLREADSAMREARITGREWMLFDHALQERATHHLAMEHDLWQALRRDELLVHYQPLLEVGTGRIVAAEALVRWEHPERGPVPPLEFIPTAEETGQITAIGRFVLFQACRQAAAWNAAGHELRISVNVAVGQLRDPGFPGLVEQVLSETGLAPGQLCLEITESSLLREAGQGSVELTRLKALGVALSMDDFGTGYSSLSHLHHMPVDELKIDRSFIGRLGRAPRDRHLVEAIVGMARALDLTVVAEGVETDEQLRFLGELGCELAQGHLFAPAVPAEELYTLLQRQRHPGLLATTL
jgi:diguanylate cyclase (GGDEF)-like protein